MDAVQEKELKNFVLSHLGINDQNIKNLKGDWINYLIRSKKIDEGKILSLLSSYFNVPYIDLRNIEIPEKLVRLIPMDITNKYLLIPFDRKGPNLLVAMSDPTDAQVIENIRFSTGYRVETYVAMPFRIKEKLEKIYGGMEQQALTQLKNEFASTNNIELPITNMQVVSLDNLKELANQAPIVKFVNTVILEALNKGASDIHIEPFEKEMRLRYRIDGVLHVIGKYPTSIKDAVIARFKVLSNMDIAEKRLPQDGRMKVHYKGREVDFRVSTVPTVHGEKIVLRILDRESLKVDLSKLGFEEREYKLLRKAIQMPYGMVLSTGPTGSGKTTTLYSSLLTVNKPSVNIMTVEDPVEYNLYGINQVEVKEDIGLNFSRVLRAFLRQDPDVIMVGEIRDKETAEIAVEAALTGHLVFSTLHTNDAPSTVTRLVDMGIERFLVSSSIVIVIAQRLARKICPYCKERFNYPKEVLREVGFSDEEIPKLETYKGRGCEHCNNTGYKGRVGLYEIMEMTPAVRQAILDGKTADDISVIAEKEGMRTLREIGKIKIAKGITTPEEVLRVTRE